MSIMVPTVTISSNHWYLVLTKAFNGSSLVTILQNILPKIVNKAI